MRHVKSGEKTGTLRPPLRREYFGSPLPALSRVSWRRAARRRPSCGCCVLRVRLRITMEHGHISYSMSTCIAQLLRLSLYTLDTASALSDACTKHTALAITAVVPTLTSNVVMSEIDHRHTSSRSAICGAPSFRRNEQ